MQLRTITNNHKTSFEVHFCSNTTVATSTVCSISKCMHSYQHVLSRGKVILQVNCSKEEMKVKAFAVAPI